MVVSYKEADEFEGFNMANRMQALQENVKMIEKKIDSSQRSQHEIIEMIHHLEDKVDKRQDILLRKLDHMMNNVNRDKKQETELFKGLGTLLEQTKVSN